MVLIIFFFAVAIQLSDSFLFHYNALDGIGAELMGNVLFKGPFNVVLHKVLKILLFNYKQFLAHYTRYIKDK